MLLTGVGPFQENYYVDSVNGNDSNNGASASTTFQTIGAMLTAVNTKSGVNIWLAKGSTWQEQLILSNNPNTIITAYGSGAMPLIDGSNVIPNGNFTLNSGDTYTYTVNVSFTGTVGVEQRLAWENDVCLTQVASIAAVEATAGTFYYDNYSATTANLYIHASNSSDVITNGKTYAYPCRYDCIAVVGNGTVVDGIRTRRQRDNNGSVNLSGDNCLLQNGICEDGHKHAAYMQQGGTANNHIFRNSYNGISSSPGLLVFNQNTPNGGALTVTGCTFLSDPAVVPSSGGIVTQFPSSVISHYNTSGSFGVVTLTNNNHTQTTGYGFTSCGNENITGDTFTNCKGLGTTADPVTVTLTNVIVTNPLAVVAALGLFSSNNPASGRLAINYVTCTLNSGTDAFVMQGNTVDISFTGCGITSQNTTNVPAAVLNQTGTSCTLTVNGCTLTNTTQGSPAFLNVHTMGTYTGDHNSFVRASGSWKFQTNSSTVTTTLAGWRTYSGQDANSTAT